MGCKASKSATPEGIQREKKASTKQQQRQHGVATKSSSYDTVSDKNDKVYKLLAKAHKHPEDELLQDRIVQACNTNTAAYQNPNTKSTPLHMAVRLLDAQSSEGLQQVVQGLLRAYPDAVRVQDASGNIPLHYAIAPSNHFATDTTLMASEWKTRAAVVRLLLAADIEASQEYLERDNVVFDDDATGGCSPLYRALETLPDDFQLPSPTIEFIAMIREASSNDTTLLLGNASDGDQPLALLYRRFTRQFDLAEKFFAGDNSRPEVVEHRRKYKTAAGNTWKLIELMLKPSEQSSNTTNNWRIVHRAVQVETPPDLLRYIVETNAEDLTVPDMDGNLPLHYAAKSKPKQHAAFPAFYTKYVVDELLYKFPEAASIPDADGNFPLTLAVQSGKQWIGGGIKSLYDAYPEALKQINLTQHSSLRRALSMDMVDEIDKEEKAGGIIRDEHHDAIMLVQQENVDVAEVVTSMWAHEEDAGVQMLGCVAISRMVSACKKENGVLRIALSAVAAVVNAMKAHPNEVIVQEKACHALKAMASADGKREISFVASGAVAAIVGAMQAHVSDPGVQEEACGATTQIIHYGGADRATIVASVSGLTAIVNAIAAHPDVMGVQREGCLALRELTEYPNANLPELPASQTEPLLESARRKFPKECGEAVEVIMSRLS